jgi:DeoR/GlpR family transcriptional regulator of sugar metabolism
MLALERRARILEIIRRDKIVRLAELRDLFDVTDETIRKDLDALEELGEITRTYGGAILCQSEGKELLPPVEERKGINLEGKNYIGSLAASLIGPGEAVFLDGSTSSLYVARHIPESQNITVVTNANSVVMELEKSKSINVMCVGGMLRKRNMSYVGRTAVSIIRDQLYASKMFFSCYGISIKAELTDSDEAEAEIKRTMMERSDKRIFLCDSTKFDKIGYPKLAGIDKIDILITDKKPSDEWEAYLNKNNVKVMF